MNDPLGLRETLTGIFQDMAAFVADFIPRLVTGIVVFLLGWILAKVLERILRTTFLRLKIDAGLDRIGITSMFRSLGVRGSLSESTSRLVYYLVLILFVQSAATAVGLDSIAHAITAFFAYLPSLVAAALLMLFGNVVAQFAGKAVSRSAGDSGVDYAPALGRLVTGSVLFIVAIMAITQLGIDTAMVRTVVIISLSGLAAGLALSFGFGSRDSTRNLMAGFYARKSFRVGDEIRIGEIEGRLSAISATRALVETEDGRIVSVPNRRLAEEPVVR
ncbi:mechanosensitive ion channel [bacterium]|nr:mechanosensitive ion channel [bacterium]